MLYFFFFFFKQKTAYEMRISDWSSDVCSSDLAAIEAGAGEWRMPWHHRGAPVMRPRSAAGRAYSGINRLVLWASAEARGFESGTWATFQQWKSLDARVRKGETGTHVILWKRRSEEPTSELQSLMRLSYAVLCLK